MVSHGPPPALGLRERATLLAAVRGDPLPPGPVDWGGLLEAADAHGVVALVARSEIARTLPPEARRRLGVLAVAQAARSHGAVGDLSRLAGAFRAAGIPLLSWKGPVLADQQGALFVPAAFGPQWSYATGAASLSPPGGSVAIVSNDRLVHRVDSGLAPQSGLWPPAWTPLRLNNPVQSRPRVVTANVGAATHVMFLGAQDGKVHCVDADTGALVWSSAVLGDMVQAGVSGTLVQFGQTYDVLMVGTRNSAAANALVGLNPATGATRWTYTHLGGMGIVNGAAAIDFANNKVYFASRSRPGGSNGTVWCPGLHRRRGRPVQRRGRLAGGRG